MVRPAGGSQVSGDPASRLCQGQCAPWPGPPLTWPGPTTVCALYVGSWASARPALPGAAAEGNTICFLSVTTAKAPPGPAELEAGTGLGWGGVWVRAASGWLTVRHHRRQKPSSRPAPEASSPV